MARKSILPKLPPRFVITPQIQRQYDGWVDYLKNISSRICVYTPYDEKVDLQKFEIVAKKFACMDDDIIDVVLFDWPEKENIAFIVCFDSSLPSVQKKEFLDENVFIFCFGNKAFGLSYFEFETDDESDDYYCYGLQNYPSLALSWKYIAKMIQDRLIAIEALVPLVPQ